MRMMNWSLVMHPTVHMMAPLITPVSPDKRNHLREKSTQTSYPAKIAGNSGSPPWRRVLQPMGSFASTAKACWPTVAWQRASPMSPSEAGQGNPSLWEASCIPCRMKIFDFLLGICAASRTCACAYNKRRCWRHPLKRAGCSRPHVAHKIKATS